MMREAANEFRDLITPKFAVTDARYSRVYLPDQKPPQPTDDAGLRAFFPYVSIWPARRFAADVRRLSDDSSMIAFRALTMAVGRTYSEVAYAEEKVREAVEGIRVVIDGFSSTPIHFEDATLVNRDPDVDDFYTSSTTWTWVSTVSQAA